MSERVEDRTGTAHRAVVTDALHAGAELVQRFGQPVSPVGGGVATVVLPARTFSLLVLGVPIPVFGSTGEGSPSTQRIAVEHLGTIVRRRLQNGHRVALQSFSQCFGALDPRRTLEWFPGFLQKAGRSTPVVLGTQLVSLYPLPNGQMETWPEGPSSLLECVLEIEASLPDLYRKMDRWLQEKMASDRRPAVRAPEPGTLQDAL